jgi:hypothetical protein
MRKGRMKTDKQNTSTTLSVTRALVILSGVEGLSEGNFNKAL